ncbi:AAA family ATPase [Candidatus Woesearchaeota archaeon]|nr:AAA family ATPase [Candidatus Woesearchaeota archaeon]
MSLFDTMLKDNESLFKNDIALDFSFQPKLIKYRENEQRQIAACIAPLFQKRTGKNILVHSPPGFGKTIAVKHIFQEIEEEQEGVTPIYINCWQKNTSFKIIIEICEQMGYKFTQNKKTEELWKIIQQQLNKYAVVFAFDEIDKLEEFDILYALLEEIYRKSIIFISNYKEWYNQLDERLRSRMILDLLEFKSYNEKEIAGILEERKNFAFYDNVVEQEAFAAIVQKTLQTKDIRTGLHLLKEAGNIAELQSSRKITKEHTEKAISKLDALSVKQDLPLEEEDKALLELIKNNNGEKIGELFKKFNDSGHITAYKTFQRKIAKLEDASFITTKKITGGLEGSTTIIQYQSVKKLTEF